MIIQKRESIDLEWERIASTGDNPTPKIQIYRLHDMNTAFEFTDNNIHYRVVLPDRDWLKRTDIISSSSQVGVIKW